MEWGHNFLFFVWSIIGFFFPMLISSVDIVQEFKLQKKWVKKVGIRGFFVKPPEKGLTKEAFKNFYLPVWKRIVVWLLSGAVSILLLKFVGINIG